MEDRRAKTRVVKRRQRRVQPLGRNEQMKRYLDLLFGDRPGVVAVAIGNGVRQVPSGALEHADFRQEFFDWPDEREDLRRWARRNRAHGDVYVAPLIRTDRIRRRSTGAGVGRWAWVDLDAPPEGEAASLLRRLKRRECIDVSSGRGRHLYVGLASYEAADVLERVNYRLARALSGDLKPWTNESLLRLPGTENHKPSVHGRDPVTVTAEFTDGRPWSIDDLLALLPDVEGPSRGSARSAQDGEVDVDALVDEIPEYLTELLHERPEPNRRSHQTFRFVAACLAAGLTADQTVALAERHPPTVEKYGDRPRSGLQDEILASFDKLAEKHDHEGIRCSLAGCEAPFPGEVGDMLQTLWAARGGLPVTKLQRPRAEAVFVVVLDTARRANGLTFDLSEYDAAERAGVSRPTAAGHLERFRESGLLDRLRRGQGKAASTYRLNPGALPLPHASQGAPRADVGTDPEHDVWTHRGLGPYARRVYERLLADGPADVLALAEVLGNQPRTIRKHLEALSTHDLVSGPQDGNWTAVAAPQESLDAVAEVLGVTGTIERRREQHERKRRGYRTFQEHLAMEGLQFDDKGRLVSWFGKAVPRPGGRRGRARP